MGRRRKPISQAVQFQAANSEPADIPFDKLLGQQFLISMRWPTAKALKFFHGICNNVSQVTRNDGSVVIPGTVLVPKFWFLTLKIQSRVFEHASVKEILTRVLKEDGLLEGMDFSSAAISEKHVKHDYCVQYRESNFDFLSRIMEEEGIFYFFKHSQQGHQMILSDTNSDSVLPPWLTRFVSDAGEVLPTPEVQPHF